jgi:hypothetical protein
LSQQIRTHTHARTQIYTRTRIHLHTHTHTRKPRCYLTHLCILVCDKPAQEKLGGNGHGILRECRTPSRPHIHFRWTGNHGTTDVEGTQVDSPIHPKDRTREHGFRFSHGTWRHPVGGTGHRKRSHGFRSHGAQIPIRGARSESPVGGLDWRGERTRDLVLSPDESPNPLLIAS